MWSELETVRVVIEMRWVNIQKYRKCVRERNFEDSVTATVFSARMHIPASS